jgi:hypothetical protein
MQGTYQLASSKTIIFFLEIALTNVFKQREGLYWHNIYTMDVSDPIQDRLGLDMNKILFRQTSFDIVICYCSY